MLLRDFLPIFTWYEGTKKLLQNYSWNHDLGSGR